MILFAVSLALAGPVYDLLKLRDGVGCDALGEATPALRDELLAAAAPDVLPASVPQRAALCLAQRFPADASVRTTLVGWTDDPARVGQVLLLLANTEGLRDPLATELVTAALLAPDERVRARAHRATVHPYGVVPTTGASPP
ncbi:MAG: hypothetical protein EXR71_00845 [Myxococcales bacterium]|nr:hypothetical protein [Myxococcales bacterium]